jgi:hypothetical protein
VLRYFEDLPEPRAEIAHVLGPAGDREVAPLAEHDQAQRGAQ